jgi:hypothetical protein
MTDSRHMADRGLDDPIPDVVEQSQEAVPDVENEDDRPGQLPFEADEADAAEQARAIDIDDDDYR